MSPRVIVHLVCLFRLDLVQARVLCSVLDVINARSAQEAKFIPFSLEASGVWGPAARRFFVKCLYLADGDRDIDVYHWSSAKFSSTWHDTFSILLARGRAQVSVATSRGDWPERTQDQAYSDQNHASAA